MKRRHLSLLAMSAAVLLAAGDHHSRGAGASHSATPAGSSVHATAGQTVHLDPATGKIIDTPPASIRALQEEMGAALSTSDAGLVIENSPVQGGGIMVNLQGRFQNASTAVIDANGALHAPCISGSAEDAHDARDASSEGPVR
jgi:hypothetical protein